MIIRVTKNDIRQGIPGDPCACPVARAIKRTLHWRYAAIDTVSIDRKMQYGEPWQYQFDTPAVVKLFMQDFDIGDDTKPFKFTLPVKRK